MVNVTAAMGALNAAAIPAAAPTGMRRRSALGETRVRRPRALATPAQHLDGGAFAAERRARAELERSDEELADGVTQAEAAALHREGDLHLRYAAAARVGDDVLQEDAAHQGPEGRRRQGPADPRTPPGGHGTVDEQVLSEGDGDVERHRGEPADDSDDDGQEKEPLGLGRRESDLRSKQVETPQAERLTYAKPKSPPPLERPG